MSEDGQYGDYSGLKVGQRVMVSTWGTVVEVGGNYVEIEQDESGDEITVNNDWDIVRIEG